MVQIISSEDKSSLNTSENVSSFLLNLQSRHKNTILPQSYPDPNESSPRIPKLVL